MTARLIAIAGFALVIGGCASSGANNARPKTCELQARDSVFAVKGPVYRDCAVDKVAHLTTTNVHPDYRPTEHRTTCYSADLEFVVDTIGKPELESVMVVRTNDDGFAESARAIVNRLLYDPALREQHRVRQIVNMHQSMAVVVSVVAAGSGPPPTPPKGAVPRC